MSSILVINEQTNGNRVSVKPKATANDYIHSAHKIQL